MKWRVRSWVPGLYISGGLEAYTGHRGSFQVAFRSLKLLSTTIWRRFFLKGVILAVAVASPEWVTSNRIGCRSYNWVAALGEKRLKRESGKICSKSLITSSSRMPVNFRTRLRAKSHELRNELLECFKSRSIHAKRLWWTKGVRAISQYPIGCFLMRMV